MQCQHFREKLEQSYKKGSLVTVISTNRNFLKNSSKDKKMTKLKEFTDLTQTVLSKQYSKFKIDSVKWHSMADCYLRKHVKKFRTYRATLDDEYVKPKKSGKEPGDGGKRIRKQQETEVIADRHAKRVCIRCEL